MDNLRARVLSLFLCSAAISVCCFVLTGSAHADSIPDPIIDTEPGCCSVDFNGTISFFIKISDISTTNCTSDSESGLTTCGTTSFITQGRLGSPDGTLTDMVLRNVSPNAIVNLDFKFGIAETAFSAQPGSIFSQVTTVSTSEAIYALGPGKSPVCSATNPDNCIGNCPPESKCLPSDVAIGLEDLLIPNSPGYVEMDITANVPEPTTLALVVSALPAVLIGGRKLRRA